MTDCISPKFWLQFFLSLPLFFQAGNWSNILISTKEIPSVFCPTFEIPSFHHLRLLSTQLNQSESSVSAECIFQTQTYLLLLIVNKLLLEIFQASNSSKWLVKIKAKIQIKFTWTFLTSASILLNVLSLTLPVRNSRTLMRTLH